MDSRVDDGSIAGMPNWDESKGFGPEEMIACGSCDKRNPPNRVACLYCAAPLSLPAGLHGNLKFRKLESWEQGFNVVIVPEGNMASEIVAGIIAEMFSFDAGSAAGIIERGRPFPAARLESELHAQSVNDSLAKRGIKSMTLSDVELDGAPLRLRGIEFKDGGLSLLPFNSEKVLKVSAAEIELIVVGAIFESRTETTHRRKSGKKEPFEEIQSSSDEPLIDLYTSGSRNGYRVRSGGFDFSCLGSDKSILAAENLNRLVSKLVNIAPGVRIMKDYLPSRRVLNLVWEPESRTDSHGVQRSGLGRIDMSNVSTSNNLLQFTKYSRLQRYFYEE